MADSSVLAAAAYTGRWGRTHLAGGVQ